MSRKALIVLALMVSGGAIGQSSAPQTVPPPASGSATFNSYDADRDGQITREEASTNVSLVQQFPKLDRNRDDALDTGEFARFEAELMRNPDDGAPSPDEIPQVKPQPDTPR
jgi:hypothetical protein